MIRDRAKIYRASKSLGFVLILIGLASLLSGNAFIPISFLHGPLSFLDYPSAAVTIMSGFVLIGALSNFEARTGGSALGVLLSFIMVAMAILSFEAIYHLTFPIYLNYFKPPYVVPGDLPYFVLLAALVMSFIMLRVLKYISFNRTAITLAAIFTILWAVWILAGFPQYFYLGKAYYNPAIGNWLESSYYGILLLNFAAKTVFMLIFVSVNAVPVTRR